MTTNSAELKRELLDDDGENRAVRSFLMLYGSTNSPSIEGMRDHMKFSGFEGLWPEWATYEVGFLTKGGAQDWLRHLFALEGRTAAQGEQSKEVGYTYASQQATKCAGCGKHKHTPLRIDAMGGYVCLTCIDKKLGALLGEFGYEQAGSAEQVSEEPQEVYTVRTWIEAAWCAGYYHAGYTHDSAYSQHQAKEFADHALAGLAALNQQGAGQNGTNPAQSRMDAGTESLVNQKGEQTAPEGGSK